MAEGKLTIRNRIRRLIQNIVGFDNFRFFFSIFTLNSLSQNKVEKDFVQFLKLVPTDKVLLDIGANFGIMTVSLAKKAVSGHVYSFEPIPENVRALKRLVKYYRLKNVTVFEHALSDITGEVKMVLPVINDTKIHGLSHIVDDQSTDKGEFFTLPVKRLDDVTELSNTGPIGAIKIDVENFEYEVFKGAKNLLLKHRPIIFCEIWNNKKRDATISFLRNELGYKIEVFEAGKLIPYNGQDALNYFISPA